MLTNLFSKVRFSVALAVLAALIFAAPAAAAGLGQGGDGGVQIPSLQSVIQGIADVALAALIVVFLGEKSKWFQDLAPQVKGWVVFGLVVVLPFAAGLLLQYVPPDVISALEPHWQRLVKGLMVWATSQGIYFLGIKPVQAYLQEQKEKSEAGAAAVAGFLVSGPGPQGDVKDVGSGGENGAIRS